MTTEDIPQYNLQVFSPWGDDTKGCDHLVDLAEFTTRLMVKRLPYRILVASTRGKMRDRYLYHVLGFLTRDGFELAQEMLANHPRLEQYSAEKRLKRLTQTKGLIP